jgi:putative endonuclease
MRTVRQRRGAFAEDVAVAWLVDSGWRVLARNARVGKDEIDVVAVDGGPPTELVCVEVRSAHSSLFGAPEERVDARKVANLYRAARAFSRSEQAAHLGVGDLRFRVDLLVVDLRNGRPEIRHLRALEPA